MTKYGKLKVEGSWFGRIAVAIGFGIAVAVTGGAALGGAIFVAGWIEELLTGGSGGGD